MDSKSKIQSEIIDSPDTPEEYHFSNPGPTDPPKRNFWIDECGHTAAIREAVRRTSSGRLFWRIWSGCT